MNFRQMVEKDLGHFTDSNPAPKSLTIPGKHWRHYELGAVVGFVIYVKECPGGKIRFATVELQEDDGNWFVPSWDNKNENWINAYWLDTVSETLQRMVAWKNKHLQIGFKRGEDGAPMWEDVVIKPIEEE